MERDSFIFYKSFYEASKFLENEEKGKLFDMICQYWLYGNEVEWEWASMWMFLLIKPQLDANNKRYINWCKWWEFWDKWWAPKWNQNAVKSWKNNTKQPQNNPKTTPNDNVNVNENENKKETITNSNTEQSSENQKENNSLSLNNSSIKEKEKSCAKKEKENWNQDINNLISQIRWVCESQWIMYNKDMERQFAKHILTAKEFWENAEKCWMDRVKFALSIIYMSIQIKYFKWACNWPKSIYQNYADIYNQYKQKAMKTITPTINVL